MPNGLPRFAVFACQFLGKMHRIAMRAAIAAGNNLTTLFDAGAHHLSRLLDLRKQLG